MASLGPVEILASMFWAYLTLEERLTTVQWLGATIILTSATLTLRRPPPQAR